MGSNNSTLGYTSKRIEIRISKRYFEVLMYILCLNTAALCIIAKMWKQLKCPWWYERNKVWYTLQWIIIQSHKERQF